MNSLRGYWWGLLVAGSPLLLGADLKFQGGSDGVFAFDTGALKGRLAATADAQGVVALAPSPEGREIIHAGRPYGLFSVYRVLLKNARWGEAGWEWPKTARLGEDGAVRITWPGQEEHPIELTATFRWMAADTLDLELTAKPQQDAPRLEVFLASYFSPDARGQIYTAPTIHQSGQPAFTAVEVSPLVAGTYLCFPRDREACERVFDGRWEKGHNPVHWSSLRTFAEPVVMQSDRAGGMTTVLMARREDCFAIGMSYNREPEDGVSGHHSTYFSLFGQDVKAGQTMRARLRAVMRKALSAEQAVEAYRAFVE